MNRSSRSKRPPLNRAVPLVLLCQLLLPPLTPALHAQQPAQTGTIAGRVMDENGAAVSGALARFA